MINLRVCVMCDVTRRHDDTNVQSRPFDDILESSMRIWSLNFYKMPEKISESVKVFQNLKHALVF
jgi:hypothetical protein